MEKANPPQESRAQRVRNGSGLRSISARICSAVSSGVAPAMMERTSRSISVRREKFVLRVFTTRKADTGLRDSSLWAYTVMVFSVMSTCV